MKSDKHLVLKQIDPLYYSDETFKNQELYHILHHILHPSITDMLLNMKSIYDTKKTLSTQLDHLILKLQACIHLVDSQVLERVLSDSLYIQKKITSINKTLKEIQLRVKKCYLILNQYQT
ncbi:hypothetical protein PCANB_002236 [Pneumocystis canis]|nr:hypothetical protein PCK1_002306 [Pneumocystis canis]KAG5438906.1 hypothetical protein PCANB_002236 [Pneumocystis canis]